MWKQQQHPGTRRQPARRSKGTEDCTFISLQLCAEPEWLDDIVLFEHAILFAQKELLLSFGSV